MIHGAISEHVAAKLLCGVTPNRLRVRIKSLVKSASLIHRLLIVVVPTDWVEWRLNNSAFVRGSARNSLEIVIAHTSNIASEI